METVTDDLYFLSHLDMAGYLENNEYSNFQLIKKLLRNEFSGIDSNLVENIININDDSRVCFLTQGFDQVQSLALNLREDIFYLLNKIE